MYTLLLLYSMKYLNSKEVSDIIGVNISTLKRWTDNGTINCHKTAGGHRKFTMQNVREYYSSNKKASKSENVVLKNFEHKKIFEAALNRDADSAAATLETHITKGLGHTLKAFN